MIYGKGMTQTLRNSDTPGILKNALQNQNGEIFNEVKERFIDASKAYSF
jgi:hypothetical protein